MSVTAGNVGQNMGIVMPVTSDVREDEEYGWPDTRTGTLDPGSAPPAAPVITNAVDDGNGSSITVSLTGTGTLGLYYRQKLASSFTTGLTRVGSGDITQTGLTQGTWYEIYATATSGERQGLVTSLRCTLHPLRLPERLSLLSMRF